MSRAAKPTPLRSLAELRYDAAAQERLAIEAALEHCGWRAMAAARILEVSESQLRRLIDRHVLRYEYELRNPGRGRPRTAKP